MHSLRGRAGRRHPHRGMVPRRGRGRRHVLRADLAAERRRLDHPDRRAVRARVPVACDPTPMGLVRGPSGPSFGERQLHLKRRTDAVSNANRFSAEAPPLSPSSAGTGAFTFPGCWPQPAVRFFTVRPSSTRSRRAARRWRSPRRPSSVHKVDDERRRRRTRRPRRCSLRAGWAGK
jgi:hypothetical protein